MFFYLRLHPGIFKDKIDSEKQFKNFTDDASLEWRQYCLDPLCTNYNQVIQNMFKHGSNLNLSHIMSTQVGTINNNLEANHTNLLSKNTSGIYSMISSSLSKFSNSNQTPLSLNYLNYQNLSNEIYDQSFNFVPLSPSLVFANTNTSSSLFIY